VTVADSTSLPQLKDMLRPILMAAAVGVVFCAVGFFAAPVHFFRAYLIAWLYWLGLGLGSLVLLMMQHITGGRWGLVLRRILEAGSMTLPLSALLFVPLVLGMGWLYPWVNLDGMITSGAIDEADIHRLQGKAPYLNVPFFLIRALIYFSAWIALSFTFNRLSRRHDRHPTSAVRRRIRSFCGPGLAVYGLTVSFAAIDWVMSLDPLWYSSIFGVVLAVSQLLPALAFAVAVLIWLAARQTDVAGEMAPETWGDLGNLLLAFAMLWAYMSFSQFFLIWSGNLPAETRFYVQRTHGAWEYVAWSLIVLYFALPFVLLLSRDLKRDPRRLTLVAGIVLVMSYVNYSWLVMPAPLPPQEEVGTAGHPHTPVPYPFYPLLVWMDVGAFVAVGGLWLAWFLWHLQARPVLPMQELQAQKEAAHA
jgi:hypothetical protein